MSAGVFAAMIAAAASVIVSILGVLAAKRKNSADAASILTGSALQMYERVQEELDEMKAEMRQIKKENEGLRIELALVRQESNLQKGELKRLEGELQLANEGINILLDQIGDMGEEPRFRPQFRGGEKPFAQRDD